MPTCTNRYHRGPDLEGDCDCQGDLVAEVKQTHDASAATAAYELMKAIATQAANFIHNTGDPVEASALRSTIGMIDAAYKAGA